MILKKYIKLLDKNISLSLLKAIFLFVTLYAYSARGQTDGGIGLTIAAGTTQESSTFEYLSIFLAMALSILCVILILPLIFNFTGLNNFHPFLGKSKSLDSLSGSLDNLWLKIKIAKQRPDGKETIAGELGVPVEEAETQAYLKSIDSNEVSIIVPDALQEKQPVAISLKVNQGPAGENPLLKLRGIVKECVHSKKFPNCFLVSLAFDPKFAGDQNRIIEILKK